MKNNYIKNLFLLVIAFIVPLIFQGQELSSKISFDDHVKTSLQIVEGAVISKTSFWDLNHQNIYTVNTIEVYKNFKGQAYPYIEVITAGGMVGQKGQIVDPSLDLSLGDISVFMLLKNDVELEQNSSVVRFRSNGAAQGFYKYNLFDDIANNTTNTFKAIESHLYTSLQRNTTSNYTVVKPFNIKKGIENRQTEENIMSISSVSPSTITAGTKSILTINGSGFGANQGTVSFKDSNSGGTTFITALSSQVVSWSDTEVTVEVPSRAGNGNIRVNTIASGIESIDEITVPYAERNFITTDTNPVALQIQHVNTNGTGGYTFQLQSDFNSNAAAKDAFLRSLETWRCQTGLNMEIGPETATNSIGEDAINVVRFDVGAELPNNNLGLTSYFFETCTENGSTKAYLKEFDISFNDTINWEFGPTLATDAKIDFETVSLHLLGHARLLEHVVDVNSNMNFFIEAAQNTRVLSENDIAGGTNVQLRSTTNPICGESIMTDAECVLSVDDQLLNDAITMFPNPAKNLVYIKNGQQKEIQTIDLFDLTGRLVRSFNFNAPKDIFTLELNQLSKGIYIINLYLDDKMISRKLVIE